jgi:hypothetical protein
VLKEFAALVTMPSIEQGCFVIVSMGSNAPGAVTMFLIFCSKSAWFSEWLQFQSAAL